MQGMIMPDAWHSVINETDVFSWPFRMIVLLTAYITPQAIPQRTTPSSNFGASSVKAIGKAKDFPLRI